MREEEWNEDVRELSAWSWGLYSSFWTSISKLIFSLHRIHLILLCDRRLHHRHLRHTEGRVWYRLEILIPHRSISLDLPHWTFQSHHLRRWWEEVFETFDFNSSSSLPSYLPYCFLYLLLFFLKKKIPQAYRKAFDESRRGSLFFGFHQLHSYSLHTQAKGFRDLGSHSTNPTIHPSSFEPPPTSLSLKPYHRNRSKDRMWFLRVLYKTKGCRSWLITGCEESSQECLSIHFQIIKTL